MDLETRSACFYKLSFSGEEKFIGILERELLARDLIHVEVKRNNCVTFWWSLNKYN